MSALRAPYQALTAAEVLQSPTTALLGVSDSAAEALAEIGIGTVFDLGSSWIFAAADAVVSASSRPDDEIASGLLDAEVQEPQMVFAHLPLEALSLLSDDVATALKSTLDVDSIADFAWWPPRTAARNMVADASGSELASVEDAQAEVLRPRLGEYPTERVYYDRLLMFGMQPSEAALTALDGAISLDPLVSDVVGFETPAVGAIATHSQSWYAQGITLGHMLHSLALAPGEATRIAVIDWSRRTRADVSESIDESEQLDNAASHSRAISEVQNAVASELQEGSSMSSGWAKTTSSGTSKGASIGGGIAGSIGKATGALGFGAGIAKSSQEAETNTLATSTSWSSGTRAVTANMSQQVNDLTEQHSTSVRNRRASAVREVSQSEHEQISTRVVANYNHMHALTVQYYEVVQVYRVESKLHKIERVLFLPFKQLQFAGEAGARVIDRFRGELIAGALRERVRELLSDEVGRVSIREATQVRFPVRSDVVLGGSSNVVLARTSASLGPTTSPTTSSPNPSTPSSPEEPRVSLRTITRPGGLVAAVDGDSKLRSLSFDGVDIDRVHIDVLDAPASATTFVVPADTNELRLATEIPLRNVRKIRVAAPQALETTDLAVTLRIVMGGEEIQAELNVDLKKASGLQTVAYLEADQADRKEELVAHLEANRPWYTRAVLSRLDSASLVSLLSGFSWQGQPLVEQVEPRVLAIAGNYLVLRAPVEPEQPAGLGDLTWERLLAQREIDKLKTDTRLVPIPTAGVFAEAVLGRSNSAEKLDITRFWNWQDSPIPLSPPEISPVSAGSRQSAENLTPGTVGSVLNISNPTPLPDPAGLSAALGVLANGQLFRDMSGLAGTQSAATTLGTGTQSAATQAGQIASANLKTVTEQATEMAKTAADMWKAVKSGKSDAASKKATAGISGEGARVNHARDMDERGVSTGGGKNGGSGGQGGGSSGKSGSSPTSGGGGDEISPGSFLREPAYMDDQVFGLSPAAYNATTPMTMSASMPMFAPSSVATNFSPFFNSSYLPKLSEDPAVSKVVADAVKDVGQNLSARNKKWLDLVCFAFVKLPKDANPMSFGGRRHDLFLYSGSLLKSAVLLASFELREQAQALADSGAIKASDAQDFLDQLAKGIKLTLDVLALRIKAKDAREMRIPEVLDVTFTGGKATVGFEPKFQENLEKIFWNQDNPEAAFCIQRLGLAYMVAALENGGFFDPRTGKGMWLAGDFDKKRGLSGVKLPTDAIGVSGRVVPSAQATTAAEMARFFALMATDALVNAKASKEMMDILRPVSFINGTFNYTIDKAKVGIGEDPDLWSEAGIAEKGGERFAYCWQNVNRDLTVEAVKFEPIYRVMEQVFDNWP